MILNAHWSIKQAEYLGKLKLFVLFKDSKYVINDLFEIINKILKALSTLLILHISDYLYNNVYIGLILFIITQPNAIQ